MAQLSLAEMSECVYVECRTSDELGIGVLIDFCHVNDRPGLLGIAQSA